MSVYDVTIVPERQINVLTCFNEKVQIKNVKMETLSIYPPPPSSPPTWPAPGYFRNCNQHKPNNFVVAALNS